MSEAYVVDKNLGQPLLLEEGDLPQKTPMASRSSR